MTSSPHGPYGMGYTRATMVVTDGLIPKSHLSSDRGLQLDPVKLESLVIA